MPLVIWMSRISSLINPFLLTGLVTGPEPEMISYSKIFTLKEKREKYGRRRDLWLLTFLSRTIIAGGTQARSYLTLSPWSGGALHSSSTEAWDVWISALHTPRSIYQFLVSGPAEFFHSTVTSFSIQTLMILMAGLKVNWMNEHWTLQSVLA